MLGGLLLPRGGVSHSPTHPVSAGETRDHKPSCHCTALRTRISCVLLHSLTCFRHLCNRATCVLPEAPTGPPFHAHRVSCAALGQQIPPCSHALPSSWHPPYLETPMVTYPSATLHACLLCLPRCQSQRLLPASLLPTDPMNILALQVALLGSRFYHRMLLCCSSLIFGR